jgi:hypothetical protein
MANEDKVSSLGQFIERVRDIREAWSPLEHKELWFRGEDKLHDTALRPKLYRPSKDGLMKPVDALVRIEMDLYNAFQDCGLQLCNETIQQENWYWDWYFLMQHHGAPTRLLDWSDGSLIALHFALRHKLKTNTEDVVVYLLNPYSMMEQLEKLPEYAQVKHNWEVYAKKHTEFSQDEWECSYLPPDDEEDLKELPVPEIPCVLHLPHITRRVAAQRSRFVVLGTDATWLYDAFQKCDYLMRAIIIEASATYRMKQELRECGITESVIPDLDGLGRELDQLWEDKK